MYQVFTESMGENFQGGENQLTQEDNIQIA